MKRKPMRNADRDLLVSRLVRWGYLFPDFEMKVGGPKFSSDAILIATSRYQEFHRAPLDMECYMMHGRPLSADGDVGPATLAIMNARTCGCPDPVLAVGAESRPSPARWPDPCKDDITIARNFDSFPGLSSRDTAAAWMACAEEYNGLFLIRIILSDAGYPNSRINATLKRLPGSTLAWSYLADDSCASRLLQAYDSTINWTRPLIDPTIKHEVGHALGLHHTPEDPDSLMYPSMMGQQHLNQTDINQMIKLGYKLRGDDGDNGGGDGEEKTGIKVSVEYDGMIFRHTWTRNGGGDPDFGVV